MTSRERITAALQHREPDRTPLFEYVLQAPVADAFLDHPFFDCSEARGWSATVAEVGYTAALRHHVIDRLELAQRLGHDMLYVPPGPSVSTAPAPVIEELPDDPVERVELRTRRAEECWAPPGDEPFLIYVLLREEMARRNLDLPILAPAYAHGVWTDVDLMQTMLLEPEVARRHFALATRRALALIERYHALGIEQIGVGGDFSGTRPLISPAAYREFIVPEVRACSRRIHAGGGWAVNASDGDLWPVIDDFLLGCEVDGYLEIDQFAGMELGPLKARFGNRVTLYGNMDCGNTLSFATPAQVRAATHACLQAGLGNGGHIFTASNAITAGVPVENYRAMLNAYREFWGIAAIESERGRPVCQ